jgi:hypothetical protein
MKSPKVQGAKKTKGKTSTKNLKPECAQDTGKETHRNHAAEYSLFFFENVKKVCSIDEARTRKERNPNHMSRKDSE